VYLGTHSLCLSLSLFFCFFFSLFLFHTREKEIARVEKLDAMLPRRQHRLDYKYHLLMYSRKIKFQATMFFICVFLSTYMKAFFFSLARNQFLTEHMSLVSLMHETFPLFFSFFCFFFTSSLTHHALVWARALKKKHIF